MMMRTSLNELYYEEFERRTRQNLDEEYPAWKYLGFEWWTDQGRDILAVYKHYSIPGAFISERLRNVACSFGTAEEDGKDSYIWFHFLCKNVPIEEQNGVYKITNGNQQGKKEISQGDFGWVRSAFCMVKHNGDTPAVTLIAFGADWSLYEKFKAISKNISYEQILNEPYCLFNVVFEGLYERIDELVWNVAKVFTQEEMASTPFSDQSHLKVVTNSKVLHLAKGDSELADMDLDFPGLHMIQRTQIYLREAIEAITVTLDAMICQHERLIKASGRITPSVESAQADFRYRKVTISSTDLRLQSMERRTQSTINLAFNLVTQTDSRVMKGDSAVMKRIAVLTMIFLPCTAVAVSPKFWR
ncbi:uncharacterized protein N7511_005566 [Penicillium nucicola]|uniref:uncharacterized protein n=1 Tax=Penicillium nucicola TaxID=1850975 RepID=UPI00254549C4|nr:uncharacterized protein N7511_005566 [Penicillium nucicola]KAJ5762184.1 hypothetical protein N7511_005566 [Penicillium nucicola]